VTYTPSPDDREQPPFVLATVLSARARVERAVRAAMGALSVPVLMFLWAGGSLAIFLLLLASATKRATGWEDIVGGVFGAGFAALLFAGGFAWLLMWTRASSAPSHGGGDARADALRTLLAPQLRELNCVRADVIRQVKARSVTRVPAGIAAAVLFWGLTQFGSDPGGALDLPIVAFFGALAGEVWACSRLQDDYRRLYKSRVLPALAARFGNLTYVSGSDDNVHRLRAARILPEFESVVAEDEISGTHRGLGVRIVEAHLERGSGDDKQTVFSGLLVEIVLPRSLTGTTAILADEGVFGNLKTRWKMAGMEIVRLEDPEFEQRYEVYSNDQIEARALLTPAFMERFRALAATSGFSLPGALAEGNRLVVALSRSLGTRKLFEPPPYWKPAGGEVLIDLEEDIRAVLRMADTVISLDFFAAGRRPHS
jgi:hypothetical protein